MHFFFFFEYQNEVVVRKRAIVVVVDVPMDAIRHDEQKSNINNSLIYRCLKMWQSSIERRRSSNLFFRCLFGKISQNILLIKEICTCFASSSWSEATTPPACNAAPLEIQKLNTKVKSIQIDQLIFQFTGCLEKLNAAAGVCDQRQEHLHLQSKQRMKECLSWNMTSITSYHFQFGIRSADSDMLAYHDDDQQWLNEFWQNDT